MSWICRCWDQNYNLKGWIIPDYYTQCGVCNAEQIGYAGKRKKGLIYDSKEHTFDPREDSSFGDIWDKFSQIQLVAMGYISYPQV
jgi:hypothetical protein